MLGEILGQTPNRYLFLQELHKNSKPGDVVMQEYGGTDRRGSVDRRSGWDRRKSKQNLNLLEMLTTHDIDGQCRKITIWLKQHYNLQGIGFLLRDPILSRPRFYADNVSEDILKDLDENSGSTQSKRSNTQ